MHTRAYRIGWADGPQYCSGTSEEGYKIRVLDLPFPTSEDIFNSWLLEDGIRPDTYHVRVTWASGMAAQAFATTQNYSLCGRIFQKLFDWSFVRITGTGPRRFWVKVNFMRPN